MFKTPAIIQCRPGLCILQPQGFTMLQGTDFSSNVPCKEGWMGDPEFGI